MSAGKSEVKDIGVILLAAGASSRLGSPKQQLLFKGETLLQRSFDAAASSRVSSMVVVLGAQAEVINTASLHIEGAPEKANVVVNQDWQEGMASSIRCGLTSLLALHPSLEGVILMVCDQPFVSPAIINDLIRAYEETGKLIVTCGYSDTFGPPTFFHQSVFGELLLLKGDIGARNIILQHIAQVEVILFPEGTIDVDTEGDYQNLQQKHPQP